MLIVPFKINRKEIGKLYIHNQGKEKSASIGLFGHERLYKFKLKMDGYEIVNGEIIHNRLDGAFGLVLKVMEKIKKEKLLIKKDYINYLKNFFIDYTKLKQNG